MLRLARSLYFSLARAATAPLLSRPRTIYFLGDLLGDVRYRWGYVGKRRSRAVYLYHMARALPGRCEAELRRILKNFWKNHQKSFLELFLIEKMTSENVDDFVSFDGLEHLEAALAQGRGGILAAPHFGNERLIHIALALKGYPITLMTSAYEDAPANLRRARLEPARRLHELVFPSDNPRKLYDALTRNRLVQFSPTAAGGTSGIWCECFGHRLLINATPARLALRTGAPLLPTFDYRLADNRHRVVIEKPLTPPPPSPAAAAEFTEQLITLIQKRVEETPDQFYWMWLVIRAQEAAGPAAGTAT